MFDRRNLTSGGVGAPIHKFEGHKAAVLCVQVVIILCFALSHFYNFAGRANVLPVYAEHIFIFQWCPDRSSVFGSSAEDGLLNIWDYEKV